MSLSRLLTLPAEIRTLIFEYVLSTDLLVTFRLDEFQNSFYTTAVQPPLLRVSKRIRSEALPIFYECNDFVLHTESFKADDARKWLRCNAQYLKHMRCIWLWIRYVPMATRRATSQGAIGVMLYRPKKFAKWAVSERWEWITTVKKPPGISSDAQRIRDKLSRMTVNSISKPNAGPEEYFGLLSDIRTFYVKAKIS